MPHSDNLPAEVEKNFSGLIDLELMQFKANMKRLGLTFDLKTLEVLLSVFRELGVIMFNRGVDYALANTFTTAQAAERLGVSKRLVIRLAHKMGVGKKLSESVFVFTGEDIEEMEKRNRLSGRPQKN